MKKVVIFLIAILYLGTVSGATVNLHYCMGEFVDWNIGHAEDNECSSCGMEKDTTGASDNCCKDEHKFVKLNDDHKSAQLFAHFLQFSPIIIAEQSAHPQFEIISQDATSAQINAPPPPTRQSGFIFIRSIRI